MTQKDLAEAYLAKAKENAIYFKKAISLICLCFKKTTSKQLSTQGVKA